ncbi:squamosa promoter-binding-like protein 14 [Actinidia eriantha]|uniref:squamosa promoter-binding-like protein 14 n=1 Tax=Actinidia eriantha TaxID=165200 RepID=UPI00258CB413|nr:squamosa promoter-binding-like protein 14 [Actinidia eriantha]
MEEVGAQVAPPIFMHQNLGGRFREGHSMTKKRGQPNFHHQQPRLTSGYGWNPNGWDWDSVRFVAKPLESDVLCLGTTRSGQSEQQRTSDGEGSGVPTSLEKNSVVDDDESLRLKLGGSLNSSEEPMSKPNKRVRSGSPGGGSYPMCQVDNCREDLSNAKDYHRRHKVCEVHSKSSNALVGKQTQRFCQQCSRFHPLSEFDEGKRSCRRRLAGHNRRRRKTQTEDVSSRILLSGNHSSHNGDLDIVNLLTVLAQAQGHKEVKSTNCSTLPSKDHLLQIISKINSLPLPVDIEAKLPAPGSLSKTVPEQASSDNQIRLNVNTSSSSTKDLLAVLSATLASPSPNALAILSQRSSQGVDADDSKLACLDQALSLNMQNGAALQFASVGGERSSASYQSPVEDSDCQVQETRTNLPLQLFSSSPEDDSPPKLACARKYFSSDSSNAIEDSSPSSSPPVAQKLFPMQTTRETEPKRLSTGRKNAYVETGKAHGCVTSLELFGLPHRGADNSSFQSLPYQAGYTSSSGSDHSPSSLNSDAQDRTGRMIFKLFGKNPSQLPETLRTQIYNWLSHSPSEMESYIRPGCVILSIYLSMTHSAWEQLEANLLRHVNSLVQDSDTEFWRNGRFLLQIGRQLASHKDGKFRLCKSWRAWHSPELISVSPLAVVGGEETSLFLRGRNLNIPGTKIHWTHTGGYLSEEVPGSVSQETVYDEISLVSFKIHGVAPGVLGRCFIEVENGFKGTSFPVIIADATICKELRLLESEFGEGAKVHDTISEEQIHDFGQPQSKEEVLHFLNELGWLFQRKRNSSTFDTPNYTLARFKFLFIFSVERNCCALVKTLLDILLERDLHRGEPSKESLDMLSEIHLLNRAVKRRCKNMVDLLIHYPVPSGDDTLKYIFPPNLVGPGGITPLHLAACTSSSDDVVDALTGDPQEIGLHCWNSLLDANGLSPYAYALMRNNHSYNRLVARKLADRKNGQVSVSVATEIETQLSGMSQDHHPRPLFKQGQKSCSKCAVVASRYNRRMPVSQGFLHRSYMLSMLAVAAVCVCVCLFLRGHPDVGLVAPFRWENLGYGPS